MAQKVLVQLVDDLDGSSSDDVSTVHFGLDGVEYEIDLNEGNAERIRKIFADYVAAARRTGGRVKRGTSSAGRSAGSGDAGKVREWALENGFELSGRGRIPSNVIEAYKEAQQAAAQPQPEAVPAARRPAKRTPAKKKA
jgi:hypothetical protein